MTHYATTEHMEIERLRRELAEAREALAEVEYLAATIENAWYRQWCERHAAALKAAREQS